LLAAHNDIEAAGVEELFFSKNVTTAAAVWQARGVVLELLEEHGLADVLSIPPNQVKMAVCGNGAATKHEVQTLVQLTFGLTEVPKPDDAADAAAVALATARLAQNNQHAQNAKTVRDSSRD
jgi:crossover junction endodeoxyribonuclease RuvC